MKMWSLQNLLFILCIALSRVSATAAVTHVSGYEGRHVEVSCSYDEGYESYEKYLCRNDCGKNDVLIKTTEAKKSKYSIYDNKQKQVFTTTISDLSSKDAGKYWCGVTRTGKDIYTEVQLEVVPDSCCNHSTKIQTYEEGSESISCSYESEDQNNLKYMCRGKQPSTCLQQAVITSDSKRNGRFRLTDHKVARKFTVTVTSLTQEDSGSYLCGVHRNSGLDVFSAVELEVKEWCCVKSHELSGIVGRPLTMQCPYPPQPGTNRKFLCKGEHRSSCTDIVTSQSSGRADLRFTLKDDASSSSFSVTISELKAGDAGTYWCGSDPRWRAGKYTKIQLSVVLLTSTAISTITAESVGSQSTRVPGKPSKDVSLYIVPPVLLLILTSVLLIVYKYKCYKGQGAGVSMNRNTIKEADTEEIYENQEVVVCSKQGTSKQLCTGQLYADAGEDQQDSVYQNATISEEIYCNEMYRKGHIK